MNKGTICLLAAAYLPQSDIQNANVTLDENKVLNLLKKDGKHFRY